MINTILLIVGIVITIVLLNIIIFIIKHINIIFKIMFLPKYFLTVEGNLTNDNKLDCFIIRNAYANRSEQGFKYMLEAVLHLLDEINHKFPNQQFTFFLVFSEVRFNSELHKMISDPCIFNYNVNNPISVNELYNLVKWNDYALNNNNNNNKKDVVLTIKSYNMGY
jgi:hypothetical protein